MRVFRHTNLILLPAPLSSDEELVLQAEVGVKTEEKVRKQLTECFEKLVRMCENVTYVKNSSELPYLSTTKLDCRGY
jgi:hypothetical protein